MKNKIIKEYLGITIGVLLVAIAIEYFYLPNNIAAGGITGLAIIINNYVPWIPTSILVLGLDSILFVIAFILIGGKFGGKSLYASLNLSIGMWLIEKFLEPKAITNDLIIATIFGTLLTALGMAIVFNSEASTGGTDIIAKILNKFFHIEIGKSLLVVDFIVTILGAITFGIDKGLYSLLAVIMSGLIIDKIINGFRECKEITIISIKSDLIAKYITDELERGCTFLKGIGGYSGAETKVLYTVLSRNEFIKLKQFVIQNDKTAFITVGEVYEVMGEGFQELI